MVTEHALDFSFLLRNAVDEQSHGSEERFLETWRQSGQLFHVLQRESTCIIIYARKSGTKVLDRGLKFGASNEGYWVPKLDQTIGKRCDLLEMGVKRNTGEYERY